MSPTIKKRHLFSFYVKKLTRLKDSHLLDEFWFICAWNRKKNRSKFFYCEINHLIVPEFLFPLNLLWDTLFSMPGKTILSLWKTMEHEPGQRNQCTSSIPVWKCTNKYYRHDERSRISRTLYCLGQKIKQPVYLSHCADEMKHSSCFPNKSPHILHLLSFNYKCK